MFVEAGDTQNGVLRQGDILAEVQFFAALNPGGISFNTDVNGNKTGWSFNNNKPEFGDVMVLSHCCEISKDNGVKLTSIILAPLRDINTATEASKKEELIQTNLIIPGTTTTSFLKYFYVEASPKLQFQNGAIVDFSKCFSVRKNYFDTLVTKKKLQLTDAIREKMALKLAAYYFRNPPIIGA